LAENESLIVLARAVVTGPSGEYERRFIYTKELMHVFDTEAEKADTPEKLDVQIDKLGDPNKPTSAQFRAEQKAFWRALMVLCPENVRAQLPQRLTEGLASPDVLAAELRLPIQALRELVRPDFAAITHTLI
jgi:hypothetical protein